MTKKKTKPETAKKKASQAGERREGVRVSKGEDNLDSIEKLRRFASRILRLDDYASR